MNLIMKLIVLLLAIPAFIWLAYSLASDRWGHFKVVSVCSMPLLWWAAIWGVPV